LITELAEQPSDVFDMPGLDHLVACDSEHVEIRKVDRFPVAGTPSASPLWTPVILP
jgi:hypothetical protein